MFCIGLYYIDIFTCACTVCISHSSLGPYIYSYTEVTVSKCRRGGLSHYEPSHSLVMAADLDQFHGSYVQWVIPDHPDIPDRMH